MKKQIIIGLFITILLSSFIYAEQQSLGTFKKNDCIDLLQTCSNCSFNNISTVKYPNMNTALFNVTMNKVSATEYSYSFCNTSIVGTYIVNGYGDPDGTITIWNYDFSVNPSGQTFNNILYEYLFFILILGVFYFLLYFGYKREDITIAMGVSFGIMFMGIYIYQYGIANLNNDYTNAFAIINICLSGYILLVGGIDLIKQLND